jgi:ABC-type amino acid transport system permease subunit
VRLQLSPRENKPLELDVETEEAMQCAPNLQSIFLHISCSTTAGHLRHGLRRAETAVSASQLDAHRQAAPAEHFKKITIYRSAQIFIPPLGIKIN